MSTIEEKAEELTKLIFQLWRRFKNKESSIIPEIDLSIQEWRAIIFLSQCSPSIMKEIADYSMVAVSTMTGIVDKLVHKGLVARERTKEDRRIVKVELTDKGKEISDWHFKKQMNLSMNLLQSLSSEDQSTLLKLLERIIQKNSN